jgi:hypothetical protein
MLKEMDEEGNLDIDFSLPSQNQSGRNGIVL